MKKIYLFLIAILIALTSCNDDVVTNPAQKVSIYEYCGYELRAKMCDGSSKNTHYYFCLQNADTTIYNVSVSKKVYFTYNLGDTIECEEENDINGANSKIEEAKSLDGGYKVVTIGGEKYLVIKIEDNIIINDTLFNK